MSSPLDPKVGLICLCEILRRLEVKDRRQANVKRARSGKPL